MILEGAYAERIQTVPAAYLLGTGNGEDGDLFSGRSLREK